MKEFPIIFSGSMVKAILAGTKTQTRRVVAHSEGKCPGSGADVSPGYVYLRPCYKPGAILWVRETFCAYVPEHVIDDKKYAYKADATPFSEEARLLYLKHGYPYKWRPSIHMPREASRITLKVTDTRMEKLQDIGEDDVRKEGVEGIEPGELFFNFISLWEAINAKNKKRNYGWDTNPLVWVVSFKVLKIGERCAGFEKFEGKRGLGEAPFSPPEPEE
jgi:hypothetical protein